MIVNGGRYIDQRGNRHFSVLSVSGSVMHSNGLFGRPGRRWNSRRARWGGPPCALLQQMDGAFEAALEDALAAERDRPDPADCHDDSGDEDDEGGGRATMPPTTATPTWASCAGCAKTSGIASTSPGRSTTRWNSASATTSATRAGARYWTGTPGPRGSRDSPIRSPPPAPPALTGPRCSGRAAACATPWPRPAPCARTWRSPPPLREA